MISIRYDDGTLLKDSPAAIDRRRGILYVNQKEFWKHSAAKRRFIVCHELGHFLGQTSNEYKADEIGFQLYVESGGSLKQAVYSLTDILNPDNPKHVARAERLLKIAKQYDKTHMANPTKKQISEILKYRSMLNEEALDALCNFDADKLDECKSLARRCYFDEQSYKEYCSDLDMLMDCCKVVNFSGQNPKTPEAIIDVAKSNDGKVVAAAYVKALTSDEKVIPSIKAYQAAQPQPQPQMQPMSGWPPPGGIGHEVYEQVEQGNPSKATERKEPTATQDTMFGNFPTKAEKEQKSNTVTMVIIVVVALALIGGAAYFMLTPKK